MTDTWSGPVPPMIEPGGAPGGLLAVHLSAPPERELGRWPLVSLAGVDQVAADNYERVSAEGGSIVLYDGDTGHPVCRLGMR